MHIQVLSRGILHDVERFFRDLSAVMLPYKWKNNADKKAKLKDMMLQVRVCPIQLYDISFPAEFTDAMLETLFSGDNGKPINKKHQKIAWLLRKGMGVKPIPKKWSKEKRIVTPTLPNNIELIALGMKEDTWIDGVEQI